MATHKIWTVKKIKALGVTTDMPTAAAILNISRANAYELARRNAFPVPIVRIGSRVIVPVAGLLRILLVIPGLPAHDHEPDPSSGRDAEVGGPPVDFTHRQGSVDLIRPPERLDGAA